jgi:hypothetical protein
MSSQYLLITYKFKIGVNPNLKTNFVLIDYENVQVKSLALLTGDNFRVRVFLGKTNTKLGRDLVIAMHALGERAAYVELNSSGPNALDFHIAFYLGELVATQTESFFHIISKDKGFDPLIAHLKSRNILAARSASIELMPCFAQPPTKPVAVQAAVDTAAVVKPKAKPVAKAAVKSTKSVRSPLPFSPLLESQIKLVVENLAGRPSDKPASLKTLLSTIHARIGKTLPLEDAQLVLDELIQKKYVVVKGLKVSYHLPKAI